MKFSAILTILLLYGLYGCAQESYKKQVRFGLKAGVNGSLFSRTVDPFGPFQRNRFSEFSRFLRFSGLGGLTADAVLSSRFSMGAEVLFNARGMAYREENDDFVIIDEEGNEEQAYNDFNYNIDYIEFPITLNYSFNEVGGKVWLAAYAGVAPAVKVHSITKLMYEKSPEGAGRRNNNEKTTLNNVNHYNNSLLIGIKVGELKARGSAVFGDFRTSYAMLPVFKYTTADNGNNLDTRMLTFSVSLGIKF